MVSLKTSRTSTAKLFLNAACKRKPSARSFESIQNGNFPHWTIYIQVITEEQAAKSPYNPFNLTKIWQHKDYPLIEAGIMELNKNPENYFGEVEQTAFNPTNIVPGLAFSSDKMFQPGFFHTATHSVTDLM